MVERSYKILLVEPDAEVLEILVASLVRRFNAQVTCVADGESCLDVDMMNPHDLVIAELQLADMDGLELAEKLMTLSSRPIILLAGETTCDQAIEALRLGVRDLFLKPFPAELMLDSADRLLNGYELRRRRVNKYSRMRDLLRRVIRERRNLNRRMELVCRDLVQAHRQLVQRFLSAEAPKS